MRKHILLVCLTALVVAGAVPAVGAVTKLITGKNIKNGTISGADIKNRTIGLIKLKKSTIKKLQGSVGNGNTASAPGESGSQGPQGPPGQNGTNGSNGSNAAGVVGPHWSTIQRNTAKGGIAQLTNGPFVGSGATGAPPVGQGSLNLQTVDSASKVSFGNQVDFAGQKVADLNQVGFHVMPTGEDLDRNANNMPSVTFEIDPNGAGGTTTHYASLVFIPKPTPRNQWSGYIDGTDASKGDWGLTGSQFNPAGDPATTDARCGLNGTRCSFQQVKAFLATGSGATILTAAVAKGTDYEFEGSVDGLRINNQVFDFESYGVNTVAP